MAQTTDNQSEQFIVVNYDDEILGYRTRFDCHHDNSLIHRAINVAVFNDRGEIVLQKRSATKDLYPSFYALSATGHVSKGESYEEAALRELKEEMGIDSASLAFISKRLVETDTEKEMVALFTCTYNGPVSFFREEVESVHWFDKAALAQVAERTTPCSHASLQILKLI